jgi:hypothetical protein
VAGLIGLVYGICTGVILSAYHEFGSPSLLKPARFMAAEPASSPSLAQEGVLDDDQAAHRSARQQALVTPLADAVPLTSPTGSAPLTSTATSNSLAPPVAEIRPAMAGPAAEPVSGSGGSAALQAPASTRTAEPHRSGDEPEERSIAAAPAIVDAAALPHPAPAIAPVPGTAVARPPTPEFKPLDLLPAVVAEAGAAAVLGAPLAAPASFKRTRSPKPSMQPVAVDLPPEPARVRDARTAASKGETLPGALRAFLTNLKILLAAAPASEFRGGGGDGGRGTSAIGSGRRPGNNGAGGPIGGGSPGDTGGSPGAGGGSASAGGNGGGGSAGSGSSGGGSAGGGGGGDSAGAGGGGGGDSAGAGGSSASSGNHGSSVSGDGGRGHGRSDGGRGRGDRGDRGDRGARGDRGDRGDRGGDRGGDDDD